MKISKKIIVCVSNDLLTDQRVHKVCCFLKDNGFGVVLVGRKRRKSLPMNKRPYAYKRMYLLFEKGIAFYLEYHLRLLLFLLTHPCTHILANDLDTLLPAFLAKKLKRKCTLVYDSHEYFTEVPELIAHPKKKRIWERIEEFVFPKLSNVYTVNNSIALKYEKKYKVKVEVVRNLAPKWNASNIPTKKALGIPANKQLLIVQGAGINIDRGVEELVDAMQFLDKVFLMIVGDGDVLSLLKKRVKEGRLSEKVGFFTKRPYAEMMYYTHYADLGFTLDKDTNLNYRFSLPNKVFDYIQAKTPIVASNLPEIRKIVIENEVGIIVNSHSPQLLAETISAVLSNTTQLAQWKQNCVIAAAKYAWENECSQLKKIYGIHESN
jgi:glycosyltransferase involved in cell wall biosynthesis